MYEDLLSLLSQITRILQGLVDVDKIALSRINALEKRVAALENDKEQPDAPEKLQDGV